MILDLSVLSTNINTTYLENCTFSARLHEELLLISECNIIVIMVDCYKLHI